MRGRSLLLACSAAALALATSCGGGGDGIEADDGPAMALASGQLVNGILWADVSGNPIHAHGGGIIKVGSSYYWFGENRNADGTFKAVTCYRSSDLHSWELRGNALTSSSAAELNHSNVERPKVIYNASTGR